MSKKDDAVNQIAEGTRGIGSFFSGIGAHINALPAETLARAFRLLLDDLDGFEFEIGGVKGRIGGIQWKGK